MWWLFANEDKITTGNALNWNLLETKLTFKKTIKEKFVFSTFEGFGFSYKVQTPRDVKGTFFNHHLVLVIFEPFSKAF